MERMRELRTRRGMTQAELAARVGWGRSRVCDLEAGRIVNPNLRTLQRIADALDVEVYELLIRPAYDRRPTVAA